MADDPEIGSAEVSIVPSLKGFKEQVAEGTADLPDTKVKVEPDATGFNEKVDAATRSRDARGRFVKVGVDVDTAEATTKLEALDAEIDKTNAKAKSAGDSTSDFGGGLSLMAVGITSALPLLPELAAGLAAIVGVGAAAGSSVLGVGAIVASNITQAANAHQALAAAQKTVDDATTTASRTKAIEEQKQLIDSLNPSVITLGNSVNALGKDWTGFTDEFAPATSVLVGGVSTLVTDLLPKLSPLIATSFGAADLLVKDLDKAVDSQGGSSFFGWLASQGPRDLLGLGLAVGNLGTGFGNLLRDFTPVENQLVRGIDNMTASFAKWSGGLSGSSSFQSFLATVQKDGPDVTRAIGDIATAGGHILGALQPAAPYLLDFVDFLSKVIDKAPSAQILVGVSLVAGLSLLNAGIKGVNASADSGLLKLLSYGTGEKAVGDNAASATPKVAALDAALGKSGLLGTLGILSAAPFVITIAEDIDSHQDQHTSAVPDKGFWGKLFNVGNVFPDTLQSILDDHHVLGGGLKQGGSSTQNAVNGIAATAIGGQALQQAVGNIPLTAAQAAIAQAAALDPWSLVLGKSTGKPAAGADSGALPIPPSAASGPTYQQTLQAMFALQGLDLGQSFLQGIQTGTSPIDTLMTSISADLGAKAQPLADTFKTLFDTALQYGQQAAQSLAFSVTAAPTVGSYTSIYMDAQGHTSTTVQSPLIGSAINTLLTDQSFVADIKKATSLGLAPSLIGQFVQTGPSSLPALDALVNSGAGPIAQLDSANASINALATTYGVQQTQTYDPQLHADLMQLIAAVKAQGGPTEAAAALATALDKTAAKATVKAATTGPRGPYGRT